MTTLICRVPDARESIALRNHPVERLNSPRNQGLGLLRQDAPCDAIRPDLHVGRHPLQASGFRKTTAGREGTIGWRLVERGRCARYRLQPLATFGAMDGGGQ